MRVRSVILAGALALAAWNFRAVAFPAAMPVRNISTGQGSLSNKDYAWQVINLVDASEFSSFFGNNGIIDRRDLMAIFQIESRFDPRALRLNDGGAGVHAYGIGQMLSSTARDIGITNPERLFDLETGVRATMEYMRWIYTFLSSRLGRQPTRREWIGSYNKGVGNALKGNFPTGYLAKHAAAKALI